MSYNKALIGAGCFWGIEEYFQKIKGVIETKVGYSGGNFLNPSYEDVCTGTTGHAEVVLIKYDSNLTYENILDNFWKCHDPSQLNRQGPDVGTQYRSVIFYYDEIQKKIAQNSKNKIQTTFSKNIATTIEEAKELFIAEEYHQCYVKKNF